MSGNGHPEGTVHESMSAKELDRLRIVQLILQRRVTRVKAGELLGLCVRQVTRLCRAFQQHGAAGLVSRKRGAVGNRRLPAEVEDRVVALARLCYQDMGPTQLRGKLAEQHGITLARETVRKILSRAGLWSPKTRPAQLPEDVPSYGQMSGSPNNPSDG